MDRALGRLPARHDPRVPMLARRMAVGNLPPIPEQVAWHAMLPADGVPMLANDKYGCCVEASACHYLQLVSLYTGENITPTEDECLQAYSDITGFDKRYYETDEGTVVMGPGGLIDHWTTKGIVVGGKLNKCGPVATVNFRDPQELQTAIYLFGGVLMGANMTEADVQSDFLWLDQSGQSPIGGHEFYVTGYVKTEHAVRYDVLTWNGMWRASDAWVNQAAQEAIVVYDEAFFNARNVSPNGIDRVALADDLRLFSVA